MKQTREERNSKARERSAAYRKTPEYAEWYARSREQRRLRKEQYRRKAGAVTRAVFRYNAMQKAEEKEQRIHGFADSHVKILKQLISDLHSAHVLRFHRVIKNREKYAKRYEKYKQEERDRQKEYKRNLPNAYVARNIVSMGLPKELVTDRLVELKRESMQFRRLSKQAKEIISNHVKDHNEAITKYA